MRAHTSGSCSVNLKPTSIVLPGASGSTSGSSTTVSSGAFGRTSAGSRSTPATVTESSWIHPHALSLACASRISPCDSRMNSDCSFLNAFM